MSKQNILFVCVENSCRSQMAEALCRSFAGDVFHAYSAGSKPSGIVNPDGIAVMKEIAIDIAHAKSKGFKELPIHTFDYAVTLGCKDTCPFIPADAHIAWDIIDPKGKGLDFFRETRDMLKTHVLALAQTVKKHDGVSL